MRGRTITTGNVPPGARPLKANDFPSLLKFDREVFGANRQSVLEWIFKDAPQYAFIVEEQGRIQGFCLGRHGYDFDQIGPIIANDANSATQLLSSALHQAVDKPIVVDILTHTPAWITFVSSLGFTELRPLIRMYRGSNNYPGVPAKAVCDIRSGVRLRRECLTRTSLLICANDLPERSIKSGQNPQYND